MEDDLKKNGRPQKNKMEDDLKNNEMKDDLEKQRKKEDDL